MGIWSTILGGGVEAAGKGIAAPIDAVGNVLDKLFTSDEEIAAGKVVLEKLRQQPHLLQAEIGKLQVQHRSLFVAGPRPFIMWVCGFALAWHFMLYDISIWVTINWFPEVSTIPKLTGTGDLISVLMALLGLGGMRTVEKARGLTK